MKNMHVAAMLLVWVGAINWGLVGLLNLNLVSMLLGGAPMLEKLVYILVGAAGVYAVVNHKKDCKMCS